MVNLKSRGKRLTLISLVTATFLLSGCSSFMGLNNSQQRQQEVAQYNQTVAKTLSSYGIAKKLAKDNSDNVYDFSIKDTSFPLLANAKQTGVEKLTKSQRKDFADYSSIIYDDFYTAYGASGVREVLVIKGANSIMYVTLIWGAKELISVDRVVQKHD